MIRVLIVEDAPMDRQLLELYVRQSGKYELLPSVESAAFAEFCCRTSQVELILMDVCTALRINGIEIAKKIKVDFPNIKIIIITGQPECSFIDRARKAGVDSFWYKKATTDTFLKIVERTLEGESVYPEHPWEVCLGKTTTGEISPREREVLTGVVCGATDEEIAQKLNVSLRTVKTHIQHMREKTGTRNRTELAVQARGSGFVIGELS